MPSDLEKFLQQAAERLAQKVNEAQKPPLKKMPAVPRPVRLESIRSSERRPMAFEDEIVEAEIIESARAGGRRQDGSDKLSSIDTRPGLAQQISQTDERMAGHMHDVFDHDVSKLRPSSSALKSTVKGETEKSIDLHRREQQVSPLIKMLQQPATLQAAFIASEIFKRKF
ncbi:MAG: hypothetical protein ABI557_15520 [Aureliella sp.]